MTTYTTYEVLEPDTIKGYKVKITTMYSSFNKEKIDALAEHFQRLIGDGVYGETEVQDD